MYTLNKNRYRYRTKAAVEALEEYRNIAVKYLRNSGTKNEDALLLELALRWVVESRRSFVTTSLVGSSNLDQLKQTLACISATGREPLDDALLWDIDIVHIRNRLPLFSRDDGDGGKGMREGPAFEGRIGERIP